MFDEFVEQSKDAILLIHSDKLDNWIRSPQSDPIAFTISAEDLEKRPTGKPLTQDRPVTSNPFAASPAMRKMGPEAIAQGRQEQEDGLLKLEMDKLRTSDQRLRGKNRILEGQVRKMGGKPISGARMTRRINHILRFEVVDGGGRRGRLHGQVVGSGGRHRRRRLKTSETKEVYVSI